MALPAMSLISDRNYVFFDPPMEGRMINGNPAFSHNFSEISM